MTRGIAYSKPLAAATLAALVAASAMFWMRLGTREDLSERRLQAASAERELRSRIASMAEFESGNVDALRRQVGRFRTRLGGDGTWDNLVTRLGKGWAAETGPREDKGTYVVQLGTLTLVSRAVEDWPAIVDAVGKLEALPGVGIADFEMTTSGSGDRRTLETAKMAVVVQTFRNVPGSAITP